MSLLSNSCGHLDPSQEAAALKHFAALLAAAARVQGGMFSGAVKRKVEWTKSTPLDTKKLWLATLQIVMSSLSGVAPTFWMPILFSWHRGHGSASLRACEKWRQRCAVALSAKVFRV